jgi:lipid-A-disaccharide synthase
MKKRIFISTGEVSGDLQGALLVEALHRQADKLGLELEILALGGDRMAAAGAKLLGHTTGIGSLGTIENLPYVLPTMKIQRQAKQFLRQNPPDLFVMIDYSDPNISIGLYARKHLPQVPTVFFIAPQEWVVAITEQKTEWIVDISDRILSIFPQEAKYYAEKGAHTIFVGHPMVDRMQHAPDRDSARKTLGISPEQTVIALFPASRQQEIKYMLPVIFQAAKQIQETLPDVQFLIPLSLERYRSAIEQGISYYGLNARLLQSGSPLNAIAAADLAITKSGTVNLEIALLEVPQVVMYRVSPFTAWVARKILKLNIPFMSPPNLVPMKAIVPEFLQDEATPETIANAALELFEPERRQRMIEDYREMKRSLGDVGVCDRAAVEMLKMLA